MCTSRQGRECETINGENGRGPGPGKYQASTRCPRPPEARHPLVSFPLATFSSADAGRGGGQRRGLSRSVLLPREKEAVQDGYVNTPRSDSRARHAKRAGKGRGEDLKGPGSGTQSEEH